MNGLIRFALSVASVPDALIGDIDKNLPGAERIVAAAREAQPHLEALQPLVDEMLPHVNALMPLLEKAMPHVNAVLPIAKRIGPDLKTVLPMLHGAIAFVEGKTRTG